MMEDNQNNIQEEIQNFSFSLQKITTEKFLISEKDEVLTEDIKLETKLKFGTNKDNQILAIFPNFSFNDVNGSFLEIEIGCYFQITEETWKAFNDDNSILFPKNFVRHLSAISIGTARGILHAKTENTAYNNYFLPTINIDEFISDNVKM